jgi:F0F1-type ATP synthase assembly protein I
LTGDAPAQKHLDAPDPHLYNARGLIRATPQELKVIAIDLPIARRLALSVVLGQAAVTLVCAAAAWLAADGHAALSAALGGGISTVASLAMALLGFSRSAVGAQRAMLAFFVGETAKVAVVIVLFVAVLKTMKVVPLAMLGTYIATFLVFWVALANALPRKGGNLARPDADV